MRPTTSPAQVIANINSLSQANRLALMKGIRATHGKTYVWMPDLKDRNDAFIDKYGNPIIGNLNFQARFINQGQLYPYEHSTDPVLQLNNDIGFVVSLWTHRSEEDGTALQIRCADYNGHTTPVALHTAILTDTITFLIRQQLGDELFKNIFGS
jgi:hypothetical protein